MTQKFSQMKMKVFFLKRQMHIISDLKTADCSEAFGLVPRNLVKELNACHIPLS